MREDEFLIVVGPLPRADARVAYARWLAALPKDCAEGLRDEDLRIECVKTPEGRLRILYRVRAKRLPSPSVVPPNKG